MDPGERPQQRIGIRRHGIGVADQADGLGIGQEREAPDRPGHQRTESFVVGRQRLRSVLPRDAVLPARDGVELIATEHHPAVLALAVHEVVRIAETGHVTRQLGAGYGLERDVLVIDRGRGDERPDHGRDLRRPDPGGVDDVLGRDRACVGQDGRDRAIRGQLEAGHADAGPDPDAQPPGRIGKRVRGAMGVEVAVARQVDRAVQRFR